MSNPYSSSFYCSEILNPSNDSGLFIESTLYYCWLSTSIDLTSAPLFSERTSLWRRIYGMTILSCLPSPFISFLSSRCSASWGLSRDYPFATSEQLDDRFCWRLWNEFAQIIESICSFTWCFSLCTWLCSISPFYCFERSGYLGVSLFEIAMLLRLYWTDFSLRTPLFGIFKEELS